MKSLTTVMPTSLKSMQTKPRLDGLDLARFLALVGMVIVNFSIVMGVGESGHGLAQAISTALHGRAAALFVVLAGIGLGLSARRGITQKFYRTQYKRALFLFCIGLLNMVVFDADILHYYAFYFAFGVLFIKWPSWGLVSMIALLIIGFLIMIISLNYDTGWNWQNYSYSGFWTPKGFIRNLFFNGWHPVIPWLSFLLWGMLLSRIELKNTRAQLWLLASHGLLYIFATGISNWCIGVIGDPKSDLGILLSTKGILLSTNPVPPVPLYILSGGGSGGMIIALCLLLAPTMKKIGILSWFTRPGRQALTLYVLHIYLGMGLIEILGLMGGQSGEAAVFASIMFSLFAIIYAAVWQKVFSRGPLEGLMRRLT